MGENTSALGREKGSRNGKDVSDFNRQCGLSAGGELPNFHVPDCCIKPADGRRPRTEGCVVYGMSRILNKVPLPEL